MKHINTELKILQARLKLKAIKLFKSTQVEIGASYNYHVNNGESVEIVVQSVVCKDGNVFYENEAKANLNSQLEIRQSKQYINKLSDMITENMKESAEAL